VQRTKDTHKLQTKTIQVCMKDREVYLQLCSCRKCGEEVPQNAGECTA